MSLITYSLLTIALFLGLKKVLEPFKHPILNPLLWSIVLLIGLFSGSSLQFSSYQQATHWLVWLLEPAVVALAIPLFNQIQHIKSQLWPVVICCFFGSLLAISSGVSIALLFTNDKALVLSILPKSVTSPIAMEISEQTGGIAPLVAGIVIVVGIIGTIISSSLFKLFRIDNAQAQGLAMGTGAHAIGTAAAINQGEQQGAFSSVALVLCGVFTALLAPFFSWLINIL